MTPTVSRELTPFAVPLAAPTPAAMRRRLYRTIRTAARYLGPLIVGRGVTPETADPADAERARTRAIAAGLRETFETLGATYMKFGQLIGSAPGVFGDTVAAEFRSCLDTGPALPFAQVRSEVENALGRTLEEAFASFDEQPLAAASIAVVHRAVRLDGTPVAVKVLRPGIEETVAADLDLMQPLFELFSRRIGVEIAGPLVELVDGFREQIAEELDLRNEARMMDHFRWLLSRVDLPLITVAEPHHDLTARTVLTMELFDGVPIDDLATLADRGIDPRPIVEQVVRAWFMGTLRNGIFHGDIHAGNLMFLRDGRLAVLDWGIVGRLDEDTHQFFRRVIEGALGDETAWDDITAHMVGVFGPEAKDVMGLDDDAFRSMVRSTIEPLLTKPFGEVSLAALLAPPQALADAELDVARSRGARDVLRRWRENRRVRRHFVQNGSESSSLNRSMFLLGKQLMYFERYGKMFLSDTPLLGDAEFFRAVLAAEPIS